MKKAKLKTGWGFKRYDITKKFEKEDDLLITFAAGFWMSRNAPPQSFLRYIQKTAGKGTNDLPAKTGLLKAQFLFQTRQRKITRYNMRGKQDNNNSNLYY